MGGYWRLSVKKESRDSFLSVSSSCNISFASCNRKLEVGYSVTVRKLVELVI